MRMNLPEHVRTIINTLQDCGHEAYAVGGCVRDSILGKHPADWDITTSARPQEVKEIFRRTVDTGIAHGTVTVLMEKCGYEVTTYRIDGEYEDARHPKEVKFTSNLLEDLKRRDFTINAMAYNERDGLIDAFDGLGDLNRRLVRCVGDPAERFSEDALRMLRAVRFCGQLGFSMEEGTGDAICRLAPSIGKVSAERIAVELVKLLVSDHPQMIRQIYETGLSRVFLPELDAMMETPQHSKHHCYTVGEHTVAALQWVRPDKILRLAVLFHDVAKPATRTVDGRGWNHFHGHEEEGAQMTGRILRRLKFDNDTIRRTSALVASHDQRPHPDQRSVRMAIVRAGTEVFPDLFEVKRADVMAQGCFCRREKLREVADFERLYQEIMEERQCLCIRDLEIDGRDLLALGMRQGACIGDTLKALLAWVLEEPSRNRRELLLAEAKKYLI